MRRKSISSFPPRPRLALLLTTLFLASTVLRPLAAQTNPPAAAALRFLGPGSCSSSGCHGGAGAHQNQNLVWATRDFHSLRPFATLTTARSKQIAEALKISNPMQDVRCTSCHAPAQEIPAALRAPAVNVRDGVSCESCHGPAQSWLRAHTRPDLTHADRVHAGLRDLKNLYVRANTCIACHQTVATELLKAGHPELIFELDGQAVTQPKHWRESEGWSGAQAWLVGQAAALREMSWQWSRERESNDRLHARWTGLLWVLGKGAPLAPDTTTPGAIQSAADDLARRAAAAKWTEHDTRLWLDQLTAAAAEFRDASVSQDVQARRAERLVLGLDRLVKSIDSLATDHTLDAQLGRLFKQVQSLPDFDPRPFADDLNQFAQAIPRSTQSR